MKPLAVDIDDVLADLSLVLHESLSRRYPQVTGVHTWNTFDLNTLFDIGYDDFLNHIIQDDLLSKAPVLPEAQAAMHNLNRMGAPIVLITSRGYHPDGHNVTEKWLKKHDIAYDDLIIVPHGMTKAEASMGKYPNGFQFLIDDHAKNIDDMMKSRLIERCVLIDRPWNRHRHDFKMDINRFESIGHFTGQLRKESAREEQLAMAI